MEIINRIKIESNPDNGFDGRNEIGDVEGENIKETEYGESSGGASISSFCRMEQRYSKCSKQIEASAQRTKWERRPCRENVRHAG